MIAWLKKIFNKTSVIIMTTLFCCSLAIGIGVALPTLVKNNTQQEEVNPSDGGTITNGERSLSCSVDHNGITSSSFTVNAVGAFVFAGYHYFWYSNPSGVVSQIAQLSSGNGYTADITIGASAGDGQYTFWLTVGNNAENTRVVTYVVNLCATEPVVWTSGVQIFRNESGNYSGITNNAGSKTIYFSQAGGAQATSIGLEGPTMGNEARGRSVLSSNPVNVDLGLTYTWGAVTFTLNANSIVIHSGPDGDYKVRIGFVKPLYYSQITITVDSTPPTMTYSGISWNNDYWAYGSNEAVSFSVTSSESGIVDGGPLYRSFGWQNKEYIGIGRTLTINAADYHNGGEWVNLVARDSLGNQSELYSVFLDPDKPWIELDGVNTLTKETNQQTIVGLYDGESNYTARWLYYAYKPVGGMKSNYTMVADLGGTINYTQYTIAANASEGTYYFKGRDLGGNWSDEYTVVFDKTPPIVSVNKTGDNTIVVGNGETVNYDVTVSVSDLSGYTIYYKLSDAESWNSVNDQPLSIVADGIYSYYAVDSLGNYSKVGDIIYNADNPFTFTIDKSGPIIEVLEYIPGPNPYLGEPIVGDRQNTTFIVRVSALSGLASANLSASDNAIYNEFAGGAVVWADGNWDGTWTITATSNSGVTASRVVIMDTTPPGISVKNVSNTTLLSGGTTDQTFTVTMAEDTHSEPSTLYYKRVGESSYSSTTNKTFTINYYEGNGAYSFYTKDSLGNESEVFTINLAADSWNNYVSNEGLYGTGTELSPYLVSNASHLAWIAKESQTQALNIHIKLEANIDLSGHYWVPIGLSKGDFSGSFDGQGYTISGLKTYEHYNHQALFGWIKSTNISNVKMTDGNIKGINYTAPLVARTNAEVTITNCSFAGSVQASGGCVGGIMGGGNATITNCSFSGSVQASGDYVGGIIGLALNITIENCYVEGSVNGEMYVGGLIGYNLVFTRTITNCYVEGSVNGEMYVGGLIGYRYTGTLTITNCYVEGSVTGGSAVGGLVGHGQIGGKISNSAFYGDITGTSDVGGIIGRASNMTIENCSAYVTTTSSVGGIVGENTNSTNVTSCAYILTISGTKSKGYYTGTFDSSLWFYDGRLCEGMPTLRQFYWLGSVINIQNILIYLQNNSYTLQA